MGRFGICVLLLLAPVQGIAQSANWTEPMAPVRIAEGFYHVGTAGLSAFLLTSEDGHVLIDAPMEENVPLLLQNIRALGFDPSDIRLHLATHAHFDHVGGFAALMAETGGDLWMSERDAPFAERGMDFGFDNGGFAPTSVGRSISDGQVIHVGRTTLTAHLTPGHTPGCTSWSGTFEIEGQRTDFVLVCSLSVLSSYRLTGDAPTYAGHGADYCRSLARLQSLSPDVFLANHGGFFSLTERAALVRAGDAAAFVDAQAYDTFLTSAEESIEAALAAEGHAGGCATLVGSGK